MRGAHRSRLLRLQGDALRFEASVVDARVYVEFGEPIIGKFGPAIPASATTALFNARCSGPKPFRRLDRRASMTWAWGLGCPWSFATSQCTLRSAIMPRSTNSDCTKSRASSTPCACVISCAGWRIRSRARAARPCGFRRLRHRSRVVRDHATIRCSCSMTSECMMMCLGIELMIGDQAARRATASRSGRPLTPPRCFVFARPMTLT